MERSLLLSSITTICRIKQDIGRVTDRRMEERRIHLKTQSNSERKKQSKTISASHRIVQCIERTRLSSPPSNGNPIEIFGSSREKESEQGDGLRIEKKGIENGRKTSKIRWWTSPGAPYCSREKNIR